jgi:hypothetical protein
MRRQIGKAILGVLTVLCVALCVSMARPILSQTSGLPLPGSGDGSSVSSGEMGADFRLEATTDKEAYGSGEVLRLTLKLLNDSPEPVSIGPSLGAMSLAYWGEAVASDQLYPGAAIGMATLTRLGVIPVPRQTGVSSDANATTACFNWQSSVQWVLPLFGPSDVAGHSTRVVSMAEIDLGRARVAGLDTLSPPNDPIPEPLCQPLEPGFYLLDCHVDGIPGVGVIQAQQVIEVKS